MNPLQDACIDCRRTLTEQDRARPKRNGFPHFPECCAACALVRQKTWKSQRGKASYQQKKLNSEEYGRHRKRLQQNHFKRTFGLTDEEYMALFAAQGGVCACCGQAETKIDHRSNQPHHLAVDHCHRTGRVRALLCSSCNISFGLLGEDPERIALLLAYAQRQQDRDQQDYDK